MPLSVGEQTRPYEILAVGKRAWRGCEARTIALLNHAKIRQIQEAGPIEM